MILFISDFDFRGSGYLHIATSLCNELATRHGRKVTALGIGYDRSQHNWPFSIIPVRQREWGRHIPAMVHNFIQMGKSGQWDEVEAIVVALDIPMHANMMKIKRENTPYIGIFPIESGPLCNTWDFAIGHMSERLVISEFGKHMIDESGTNTSVYIPIGIDSTSWRMPSDVERKAIRKGMGYDEDQFVVLTVADNQERKNLSIAADVIERLKKHLNVRWSLVTRINCPVGWKLDDLMHQFDIIDQVDKYDKGLAFDRLWMLYASADAFLLTSKAEGLCLPILEAMATGLPVVATSCTAIPEHIWEDPDWSRCSDGIWHKGKPRGRRGYGLNVEYTTIDPWGNSVRSFPDPKHAVKLLRKIAKMKPSQKQDFIQPGRDYAVGRTWQRAGNVLEETLKRVIKKAQPKDEPGTVIPSSQPRVIPEITEENSV